MESKSGGKSKALLIWGVPILVIIALVLILVTELTDNSGTTPYTPPKTENKPPVKTGEEVQTSVTDSQKETSRTLSQEVLSETKGEEKTTTTDMNREGAVKTVLNQQEIFKNIMNIEPGQEESERSYIMEEGDSLWKIAQRKDFLGDPWKWKTILIQNREKINYTIFSEETGRWKVMINAGKKLVFKAKSDDGSKLSFDRARKKRYAVQLMSLDINQLEKAVNIVKLLIKDGYHSYLYRTRDKIKAENSLNAEYYYRIRVGFFETEDEALKVGEEILYKYEELGIFPVDYWAVLPSYDELDGELIDFGVQRNKPWIIQLGEQNSRKQAIDDLKILASLVDFSYISQKSNPDGGFFYRIRVGFFETRKEAGRILNRIRKSTEGKFYNAKILELRHVMESIPGQTTAKTLPK